MSKGIDSDSGCPNDIHDPSRLFLPLEVSLSFDFVAFLVRPLSTPSCMHACQSLFYSTS